MICCPCFFFATTLLFGNDIFTPTFFLQPTSQYRLEQLSKARADTYALKLLQSDFTPDLNNGPKISCFQALGYKFCANIVLNSSRNGSHSASALHFSISLLIQSKDVALWFFSFFTHIKNSSLVIFLFSSVVMLPLLAFIKFSIYCSWAVTGLFGPSSC